MSGWGKFDSKSIGNVYVINGSRAVANSLGTGANANSAFLVDVKAGDYLALGAVTSNTNAKYQVANVSSNVLFYLTTPYNEPTTNAAANVQQGPKFITNLSSNVSGNTYTIQRIVGVDSLEASLATNKANGFNMPGWAHQTRYRDAYGVNRVKTEVLVAMSKNFNRIVNASNGNSVLQIDANDNAIVTNI
jgi:hypothetical protein